MLRAANAPEATADPMADAVAGLIVICAGVAVAMALPAVVPVAVAFGADRLIAAKAPDAVALVVAFAVAVAGVILSAANDPDALALPPADAVAVGAVIVIAAHAPVADALPDALGRGYGQSQCAKADAPKRERNFSADSSRATKVGL